MSTTVFSVTVCVIIIVISETLSTPTGRIRRYEDGEDYDMRLYDDSEIYGSDTDDNDLQRDTFELPLESNGSELIEMDRTEEELQTDESKHDHSRKHKTESNKGGVYSSEIDSRDALNEEQFSNISNGIIVVDKSVSDKKTASRATNSKNLASGRQIRQSQPRSDAQTVDIKKKKQEKRKRANKPKLRLFVDKEASLQSRDHVSGLGNQTVGTGRYRNDKKE